MRASLVKCNTHTAAFLLFLSFIAQIINYIFFQYPGNNYFPPHAELIGLTLVLIYSGLLLQLGRMHKLSQIIKEIILYFFVLCILAYATTAIQYTPFSPVDQAIIDFESQLHINLQNIVAWTYQYPWFAAALTWIYASLPNQMTFIPLLVIASGNFSVVRQYYFLLLITGLIGFTIYYFFPTTAPASMMHSPYFSAEQKATGIKFFQIHHYIPPSTIEGGMIAFPSFHVIWAWGCAFLFYPWKPLFALMIIMNFFLVLSCVLLGWHYPTDILASILLIILAHVLLKYCKKANVGA